MQPKVELLDHMVDKEGIHVDDQKVVKIKEAEIPTSRKELLSFLGLSSYYRRFIPGFAKISKPLVLKTSEKVKFEWTDTMQDAFECLKTKLTTAPVLAYPDYKKPFVVCTDASSKAVGAVLSQLDDNGREHPVHYASRVLSGTEVKYSAFEREALAVIFALKKFRHYLLSMRFKLYTDHQALKYVFNMKDPHGRIARWFSLLAEYDFEICYRSGNQNPSVDFISRPVELMAIMENISIEPDLKLIANYLHNHSVNDPTTSFSRAIKIRAKNFLVHENRL